MKYNGFYYRMSESSMKKVLVEKYGKQYANEIMRKSKKTYRELVEKADDIGDGNPMEAFTRRFLHGRCISRAEALHIPAHVLKFPLVLHGKLRIRAPVRKSNAARAGLCDKLKVVRDDDDGLFPPHLAYKRRAAIQTFRVLPGRRLIQHYNGLFRQKRRHERQLLHLPAGKGKRVSVAALPHAHAPHKRLGGLVKLRRGGVAVFKLIYDGISEELELGLLHDEHDLRSKLLGRSATAEECDLPRGGLIKPRDELAKRRLAAAAAAAQHDAAPRRNAPGGLLQGRLFRLRVLKFKFKIYHTNHFFLSVS